LVDAQEVKKRLAGNTELRLVLLSACHTAGLAAELASAVPATIGMRGTLTAQACADFASGVYTSLLDAVPLEVGLTGGRQGIDIRRSGSREWGLPRLYLQAADGTFLVRRPGDMPVRGVVPAAEPPSDPKARQEWESLRVMREIYQRNLEELEAQVATSLGKALPLVDAQIRDTKAKIAELDEQLMALYDGQ
jgi:hypothetical protein